MNKMHLTSIPIGILLIAGFYIFGAFFLLVSLLINPAQAAAAIAVRHGLQASTGSWILPVIAGFGLLIAYGLLSLSRWGFYLTVAYLLYFGAINLYLSDASWVPGYCGDAIWSFLVVGYLFLIRGRFFDQKTITVCQGI